MNYNLSVDEMAKAGLQFGHTKAKVHPKMKPYLFGVRNTIFLIDLDKVKEKFEAALEYIEKTVGEGKIVLLVGTKTQFRKSVKAVADETGMPYVSERWLGGTFTNFKIIKKRVDYYKELERKTAAGEFEKYTKKEQAGIQKEIKTLEKKLGGIKTMDKMPEAIFVVDMRKDKLAVKEARENGIKVIGIADINIDPDLADNVIIANDDSISSVGYIMGKVREAILEGKKEAAKLPVAPVTK
ncbi:MAG: 30S ribosomal protein S2 [Candidatus Pacebacteria bacterium]|jgi:small subunit ribosomal protein S2|nr:30S ribosomal protein S2 [Candidatus Paceibacterota bacterium]